MRTPSTTSSLVRRVKVDGRDESALLDPARIFVRDEVLTRPSPVPASPGVYAWYFDEIPPTVPVDGCHQTRFGTLLYVGISPSAPPAGGGRQSRQTLRKRLRQHYRGNASGSTLRLSLGSLLAEQLDIQLRRVGRTERLTFADDEAVLSRWMAERSRVCWVEHDSPWILEGAIIANLTLPLNLKQNSRSAFYSGLKEARAVQRRRARQLPVLPRR